MRLPPAAFLALAALLPMASQAQYRVVEKPEFERLVPPGAIVEKLLGGFKFVEGPAYDSRGGFLVFSDFPADRIYRYDPGSTAATVFREPSHHANGNIYDADGELISCEHGSRSVTVQHRNGATEVLADRYEGKLLNSPNDVAVKSDGSVWFTDPTYGLEGRAKEQAANHVFCIDPRTRELRAVAGDFDEPNGLCFSPDERRLYIADSGKPRHVRVFDVTADNALTSGRVFCTIEHGVPDGMRCDKAGNLYSTAGDGIYLFNPDGERLGKILVAETPANLCFGGADGDELYITARTSLYRIKLAAPGK